MPLCLSPTGRISETTCLKHKPQDTTASGLPSDNFILKIVSFAKDKPCRWGSNLLEVEKKAPSKKRLNVSTTLQPTTKKIQISKALIRQSFFLFFIKIIALWNKKGSRRNPMSFFTRDTTLKIVFIMWKDADLLTSIKCYHFSEHTHQGAENSWNTGGKVTTVPLYRY